MPRIYADEARRSATRSIERIHRCLGLFAGLTLGVGFILDGQMMALFVEMRDLLAHIASGASAGAMEPGAVIAGDVAGEDP